MASLEALLSAGEKVAKRLIEESRKEGANSAYLNQTPSTEEGALLLLDTDIPTSAYMVKEGNEYKVWIPLEERNGRAFQLYLCYSEIGEDIMRKEGEVQTSIRMPDYFVHLKEGFITMLTRSTVVPPENAIPGTERLTEVLDEVAKKRSVPGEYMIVSYDGTLSILINDYTKGLDLNAVIEDVEKVEAKFSCFTLGIVEKKEEEYLRKQAAQEEGIIIV